MHSINISDKEYEDGVAWMRQHECEECDHLPTLGEHFYWKIIPNGLGGLVEVGCIYCGAHKDVTDIDSW